MGFGIAFLRYSSNSSSVMARTKEKAEVQNMPHVLQCCFCLKDSKKSVVKELSQMRITFSPEHCEELASDQIGNKIRTFLESWDTQGFSLLEIQQERQLWKGFFLQRRNNNGGVNELELDFFRKNPNIQYSIRIVGPGIEKVDEVLEESFIDPIYTTIKQARSEKGSLHEKMAMIKVENFFNEQKKSLTLNNLNRKEKIVITIENTWYQLTENTLYQLTEQDRTRSYPISIDNCFGRFLSENQHFFQSNMLEPFSMQHFSLAPTITKVIHCLNSRGIILFHTFSVDEVKPTLPNSLDEVKPTPPNSLDEVKPPKNYTPLMEVPVRFFSSSQKILPFRDFTEINTGPSSIFLEAGFLAFPRLPFTTYFGLSRVSKEWHNMLHEKLQTNHQMIYSVLYGEINSDLIEYTKDEKKMTEFVLWLKDLPVALLDNKQSAIPDRIDKMISILCIAKEDKKVLDIAKIILGIYLKNNMTDSIKNVMFDIFQTNNIKTLYGIISYYPELEWISRIVWVGRRQLFALGTIYEEIENFLRDSEIKSLDDISRVIAFLRVLNTSNFNLDFFIEKCSQEKNALENYLKELDDLDRKQREIINFAEQQYIIDDCKKGTCEINMDDFMEEELYSEDEAYDDEVYSKNEDEEVLLAKALKDSLLDRSPSEPT